MTWSADTMSSHDPVLWDAAGQPLSNEGQFVAPAPLNFATIIQNVGKVYSFRWDEALRDSPQNALAMRRDAFYRRLMQERTAPTINLDWEVKAPDEDDPAQEPIRAQLQRNWNDTRDRIGIITSLSEKVWYGRAGVQGLWGKHGSGMKGLVRHEPVNGDSIQYCWDGTPCILVSWQTAQRYRRQGKGSQVLSSDQMQRNGFTPPRPVARPGEPDPDVVSGTDRGAYGLLLRDEESRRRFVIATHVREAADYYEGEMSGGIHGVGLRSWAYWSDWMKKECLSWMLGFMQSTGMMDLLVFNYPAGNEEGRKRAEANAKLVTGKITLLCPRDPRGDWPAVEQVPMNDAGVQVLMSLIKDYFDVQLEHLFVGQSMSTGGRDTGSLGGTGRALFAQTTKAELLKTDALRLGEDLTRDWLTPARDFNFPGCKVPFYLAPVLEDPKAKEKVDNGLKLAAGGVPVSIAELRKAAGLREPKPGEPTIGGQQQPGQGSPVAPPSPGGPGPQFPPGKPPPLPPGEPGASKSVLPPGDKPPASPLPPGEPVARPGGAGPQFPPGRATGEGGPPNPTLPPGEPAAAGESDTGTPAPALVLAAMLAAAEAGDTEAVDRLAGLGDDPDGLSDLIADIGHGETGPTGYALHYAWQWVQNKGGKGRHIEDGGRKVYGKRAEQIMARQERGEPDPERPADKAKRLGEERERGRVPARDAFRRALANPEELSAADLPALAEHLKTLKRDELRDAARTLNQKTGGRVKAQIVQGLLDHVGSRVRIPLAETPGGQADEPGTGRPADGSGSGGHAGGDASPGGRVAGEAGGPGGSTADRGGGGHGQPAAAGSAGRVPATTGEVNKRLDRFAGFFRAKGQHQVADWLDRLRSHVNAVGAESALAAVGGAGRATGGDPATVQYWGVGTEEANWKNMGAFMEAYLARNGIVAVTGEQAAPGLPMVSALAKPDPLVTSDFKPVNDAFRNKLEESQHLPGLEASQDLGHVIGRPVTHLTPDVTAKLDQEYGAGRWIVKCYSDEAAAGYGIYFPQRAAQIPQDARNVIWSAGERLGRYGFEFARDEAGRISGIKHGADVYPFGSDLYDRTINGEVRAAADSVLATPKGWGGQVRDNEHAARLPDGAFMVQPAFAAVGISDADRAAGKTWHEKNEGRVHLVTRPDGTVSVIPHATWLKGGNLPVVFEDEDTKAMAEAARQAIEQLPGEARAGQVYAPDVMKTADGYRVVELNAQGDYNGSGYLHDNHFTIDAYTSFLTGREPMHVRFIRQLLSSRQRPGPFPPGENPGRATGPGSPFPPGEPAPAPTSYARRLFPLPYLTDREGHEHGTDGRFTGPGGGGSGGGSGKAGKKPPADRKAVRQAREVSDTVKELIQDRDGILSDVDRKNLTDLLAGRSDAVRAVVADRLGLASHDPAEMTAELAGEGSDAAAAILQEMEDEADDAARTLDDLSDDRAGNYSEQDRKNVAEFLGKQPPKVLKLLAGYYGIPEGDPEDMAKAWLALKPDDGEETPGPKPDAGRATGYTNPAFPLGYVTDAAGHEHKGSGPGGGQFTSKGGGQFTGPGKGGSGAGRATGKGDGKSGDGSAEVPSPAPASSASVPRQRANKGTRAARGFVDVARRRRVIKAVKNEGELAEAIGGYNLPDSEPADVVYLEDATGKPIEPTRENVRAMLRRRELAVRTLKDKKSSPAQREGAERLLSQPAHFFEVKTLLTAGGAGTVHMSKAAVKRKQRWEDRYHVVFSVVAIDDRRGSKHSGHRVHVLTGELGGTTHLAHMRKAGSMADVLKHARGTA